MKLELNGKTYELREPLTEDVERVIEYDNKVLWDVLDLKRIKHEDKNRDIMELITEQLVNNPEKLKKYLLHQRLAEPIKTVMLCTGATAEELKHAPLRPLYKKCREFLGGTAADFFRDLGISTTIMAQEQQEQTEEMEKKG